MLLLKLFCWQSVPSWIDISSRHLYPAPGADLEATLQTATVPDILPPSHDQLLFSMSLLWSITSKDQSADACMSCAGFNAPATMKLVCTTKKLVWTNVHVHRGYRFYFYFIYFLEAIFVVATSKTWSLSRLIMKLEYLNGWEKKINYSNLGSVQTAMLNKGCIINTSYWRNN